MSKKILRCYIKETEPPKDNNLGVACLDDVIGSL